MMVVVHCAVIGTSDVRSQAIFLSVAPLQVRFLLTPVNIDVNSAEIARPSGAIFEVRDAAPLPTSPNPKPQADNHGRRKLAIR
jgi:hypothetical protein